MRRRNRGQTLVLTLLVLVVAACGSTPSGEEPTNTTAGRATTTTELPAPDPSTYANGILNGTWDFVLDEEGAQLLLEDYADYVDSADEVTVRIGFDNHEWWEGILFDGELVLHNGVPEGSGGTFIIDGNELIIVETEGYGVNYWTLTENQLTLEIIEFCPIEDPEQTCYPADPLDPDWELPIAIFNHTFTKSSDDPSY